MTFKELKTQLLNLTPAEKAELIQMLTINLSKGSPGITKIPDICGGEACIAGTRIPVWGLVESRSLGISEGQILDDYSHISAADLVNAWAYADAYPEEIEQAIKKNQEH